MALKQNKRMQNHREAGKSTTVHLLKLDSANDLLKSQTAFRFHRLAVHLVGIQLEISGKGNDKTGVLDYIRETSHCSPTYDLKPFSNPSDVAKD